jgi:hypothetical protein
MGKNEFSKDFNNQRLLKDIEKLKRRAEKWEKEREGN